MATVPLYSCNNTITLKMTAISAETCGEKIVNKICHKQCNAFCLLFIYYGPGLFILYPQNTYTKQRLLGGKSAC